MNPWRELWQAGRRLRRAPGYTTVALATLAVGIGASVAIFSVVNAVLLSPLPYRQPGQLYLIHEAGALGTQRQRALPVNADQFHLWRQRTRAFSAMAIAQDGHVDLTQAGQAPALLNSGYVSAGLLPLLGARLALGRNFTAAEDRPNGAPVAILTHRVWVARFRADPAIIGKIITLNNHPRTVVGVLAAGFRWPFRRIFSSGPPRILEPLGLKYQPAGSTLGGDYNYRVIARLRPATTVAQARVELDAIENQLTARYAPAAHLWTILAPVGTVLAGSAPLGLGLLLLAALAVLLIGCVNLANLALARATGSAREMGVRAALGAGRGALMAAQIAESVLLAILGGAIGLLLAWWAEAALLAWVPAAWAPAGGVHWDWRMAVFALALVAGSALLFGAWPAWRHSRADPQLALASGGRAQTETREAKRRGEILTAAEVALGAVLLVAAGLFLRSLWNLANRPSGIQLQHTLTVQLLLPSAGYNQPAKISAFYAQALANIRAVGDVHRAAVILSLPLGGDTWFDDVERPGQHRPANEQPPAQVRFASPGVFSTLGIRLLRGRGFAAADQKASPNEAVISRQLARTLWPRENPVGQAFVENGNLPLRVIGVAGDVLEEPTEPPLNVVYQPYWTFPFPHAYLAVRSPLAAATLAPEIRRAIWKVDPTVPVEHFQTMEQVAAKAIGPQRFESSLLALFAAAALLLAGLVVFGVVSYSVGRRRREIGVRAALGARPEALAAGVLRQALRPVAIGLAIGMAAALVLGRLAASLLFSVRPADPVTLAAALILLAAGLLAAWLPARRAAAIDPAQALRQD